MTVSKAPVATEHQEQAALFSWAAVAGAHVPELRLMFAIPNGAALVGKTVRPRGGKAVRFSFEAMKLRAEGLKAGIPDVCLPVARSGYHGLYIEMKRLKGGTLAPEQKQWMADLTAQGYRSVRCNGWAAARTEILKYLEWDEDDG